MSNTIKNINQTGKKLIKFKKYIVLLPVLFASLLIFCNTYNYLNKSQESIILKNILLEKTDLIKIALSISNEEEYDFKNKNYKKKTNEILNNTEINKKTLKEIEDKIKNIRKANYTKINYLSVFENINKNIKNGYKQLDQLYLNNYFKYYINILKSNFKNIDELNKIRYKLLKQDKQILNKEIIKNSINIDNLTNFDMTLINDEFMYKKIQKFKNNDVYKNTSSDIEIYKKDLTEIDKKIRIKINFLLNISDIIQENLIKQNRDYYAYNYRLFILLASLEILIIICLINLLRKLKFLSEIESKIFNINRKRLKTRNVIEILEYFHKKYLRLLDWHKQIKKFDLMKNLYLKGINNNFKDTSNKILHNLAVLRKNQINAEQNKRINNIEQACQVYSIINENIENIINFESKNAKLIPSSFDPQILFKNIITANLKDDVNIITFIDPNISNILEGDSKKISSIISNILQSIILQKKEFTKIIIEIQNITNKTISKYTEISISIKDNINIIDDLYIDEILNHNNENDKIGFSLAISNLFLNLMDSSLEIKNIKNISSEFFFTLKLKNIKQKNHLTDINTNVKIAYIKDSNSEYNDFFTKTLSLMNLNFDSYANIDSVDPNKNYNIILSRNDTKSDMYANFYTLKDPLNSLDILQIISTADTSIITKKSKINALVIDDNSINIALLKNAFCKFDINTKFSNDSKNSLEMLKNSYYDIVFIGSNLSILDSKTIVKKYREYEKSLNISYTPIIGLKSNTDLFDDESNIFDDTISKPIKNKELEYVLNKFIKNLSITG